MTRAKKQWQRFHAAAQQGDVAAVAALLLAGARVDAANKQGETALHKAAREGHAPVVTALLQAGARVDAADKDGVTALHEAAANGHAPVVAALLQAGARVDVADEDGDTALQMAFSRGHAQSARLLLNAASDARAQPVTDDALVAVFRAPDADSATLELVYAAGRGSLAAVLAERLSLSNVTQQLRDVVVELAHKWQGRARGR
jgi:ankyrin repeat protein